MIILSKLSCEQFLKLNYIIGIKALKQELKTKQESMLWDMWLTMYPNMTQENFMSFEEFKMKSLRNNNDEVESRNAIDQLVKERRSK